MSDRITIFSRDISISKGRPPRLGIRYLCSCLVDVAPPPSYIFFLTCSFVGPVWGTDTVKMPGKPWRTRYVRPELVHYYFVVFSYCNSFHGKSELHCNKRQRIYFCRIGNVPHAGEFATVVSVELRLEKLLLASWYIWPGNMVIMMLTRSFRGKRVSKNCFFFDSMFFNSFDLLSFKILN